ncbi:MAG TPA: AMP-binding protein, partial [Spirochaetota bacterium]|nr:AMP-binding protein [Spirochaetota bacterium]
MLINRLPKTAFIYDDRETSYDELVAQIEKYAAFLSIKEGERVLLFSENRPEWIYAFYASWGLGGVNVPVDAGINEEGLRYIINDCRPSVIFCSAGTSETAVKAAAGAAVKPEIIIFENILFVKEGKPVSLEPGDAASLAVIVYTSGTTGEPKGVMLTFGNLVSNIEALERLEMFKVEDRILGLLPFHHILPLQGIVIAAFY